jgi:hypothetical protein
MRGNPGTLAQGLVKIKKLAKIHNADQDRQEDQHDKRGLEHRLAALIFRIA